MRAWSSLQAWRADADGVLRGEATTGQANAAMPMRGPCGICGRDSLFGAEVSDADAREGLHCSQCGCNARQRAAAMVLLAALSDPERARVHASEQASDFFLALRHRVGRLTGSEYAPSWRGRLRLSLWLLRRGLPAWVRHGDVSALRRRDAALDGLVSLDVLEHVADYQAALRESARVLRPGGVLVLTVPFYDDLESSVRVARLRADGSIEHFGEPEFHGDPLAGSIACFHHFGWDLVQSLRDAGFAEAAAVRVFDPARGLPCGLWVLRARR